eukprot:COSAG06_NODE_7334_length_2542_cov_1.848138_2_plen_305_part_00
MPLQKPSAPVEEHEMENPLGQDRLSSSFEQELPKSSGGKQQKQRKGRSGSAQMEELLGAAADDEEQLLRFVPEGLPLNNDLIDRGFEEYSRIPKPGRNGALVGLERSGKSTKKNAAYYDADAGGYSSNDYGDTESESTSRAASHAGTSVTGGVPGLDDHPENNAATLKRQLEDLRVKSVYGLVEFLTIEVDNEPRQTSMMFLSNQQASSFPLDDLTKLLSAMNINAPGTPGGPNLIINLPRSFGGVFKTSSYGRRAQYQAAWSTVLSHHTYAETDKEAFLDTVRAQAICHNFAPGTCVTTGCLL